MAEWGDDAFGRYFAGRDSYSHSRVWESAEELRQPEDRLFWSELFRYELYRYEIYWCEIYRNELIILYFVNQ